MDEMSDQLQNMAAAEAMGGATLRRVEWLTLVIGGIGAAWAGSRWGWRGALGLAIGAVLSTINFRWLKGSVQDFGRVAQPGMENAGVPKRAFFKFFGRFALLLGVVYVILTRTSLPGISVLAGLFASTAAVVVGLVFELLSSNVRTSPTKGS
jgi:hypothetical protein